MDLSAGSSSTTYDEFGNPLKTTNALGQETITAYDSLGRVDTVTKPEGIYKNIYRVAGDNTSSSKAIGKIKRVEGPGGYLDSISYDSFGRAIGTSSNRFGETFTTSKQYDALGRPVAETDAGGMTVLHDYDTVFSAKIRSREQASNTTLWEPRFVDSSGRVVQQVLAHGVETLRTPNPANGTLTSIMSTGQGKNLQTLAYTWDNNGNLLTRADVIASRDESFTYDGLNRLTSSTITGQGTTSYTYAANGNLLTKGGDTLSYGGSSPYAVSAATIKGQARTYGYDAAGRATGDTLRTYGWTSFHQLAWVSQISSPLLKTFDPTNLYASQIPGIAASVQFQPSAAVTQFDFDATGNRARQFLTRTFLDTSVADVTTLYLGSYEREIHRTTSVGSSPVVQKTLHRHQFGAAVYTIEEKPGNSPLHKLAAVLTDHLGSTDVMLIGTWNGSAWSGFKAERQSFNPWGERRNADDWSPLRTSSGDDRHTSSADFHRGYTGHEMLDDFGLIHMNGRIYDPELGRFLSPDPVVQVPEYSQNFNRYSYVLNNPLTFTDPSGHFIVELIVAVVTAIVNLVALVLQPVLCLLTGNLIGAAQGIIALAQGLLIPAGAQNAFHMGVQLAMQAYKIGSTVANGGSFGDVLRGLAVSYVSAQVSMGPLHKIEEAGVGFGTAQATVNTVKHVAGHALLGGASQAAMGGRFQDGFLSAGVSTLAMDAGLNNLTGGAGNGEPAGVLGRTAVAGIVGGTASAIGGGKFGNGAFTAAWQHLLNYESGGIAKNLFSGVVSFLIGENGGAAWANPKAALDSATRSASEALSEVNSEGYDSQINDNKYGHAMQMSYMQRKFGFLGSLPLAFGGLVYEMMHVFVPGHVQGAASGYTRNAPFFGITDGQNPLNWLWDTPGDLIGNTMGQINALLGLNVRSANRAAFMIPGPNYSEARANSLGNPGNLWERLAPPGARYAF